MLAMRTPIAMGAGGGGGALVSRGGGALVSRGGGALVPRAGAAMAPRASAAMAPRASAVGRSARVAQMAGKSMRGRNLALLGIGAAIGISAGAIGLRGKSSGGTGQVPSQNMPMY